MTNIIHESFKYGSNFKIGEFCVIKEGVIVGDNVTIGNYSMILTDTIIGDNSSVGTYTKIGKNVTIGSGCSFTSFCEIRDRCVIGNIITMGSRCTLSEDTVVEDGVVIKYSFVYTDTPILSQNDNKIVGVLKTGSRFGANVTIMPGVTVGINSEIGACSLVRNNIPDNEIWYGTPAKFYKKSL